MVDSETVRLAAWLVVIGFPCVVIILLVVKRDDLKRVKFAWTLCGVAKFDFYCEFETNGGGNRT